jgi:hypothetical protein
MYGYAAAYVHLFYVLSCVERYVDWFPFRCKTYISSLYTQHRQWYIERRVYTEI